MPFRRILVLGGARSGKSAYAERLAIACGGPVIYVAMATAADDEMAQRIARHQAQRPVHWRTIEVLTGVADRVSAELGERPESVSIIVEDLTFLLSNMMTAEAGGDDSANLVEARAIAEVQALLALRAHVIVVSNEVGMGVVPPYPLGRRFRDALGRLNQSAAGACEEVYILFAGLPVQLK
ncbi:MAG: bifunctional adenosylcobinamide kinase/adenosylcobinamide-phosphate guanylyltransferase [Chloroflexi bacterium]|nr:bifunctional adenosylcobinamide kinase/adenosylcobinamide-phosphate guanylyltransferase [Chloroflexota bacterium]